jgi:hypothetical protein
MEESTRDALTVTARAAVAAACIAAVITARPTIGWGSLAIMLAGLVGLLALLASYNRRFR